MTSLPSTTCLPEPVTLAGVEEIPDLGEGKSCLSEPTQQDKAPSQTEKEAPPLPESEILTQFSNFVEEQRSDNTLS